MAAPEHRDTCKEVFALLSDYLNIELPPDTCKEVEAHLAGCPPCVEFVESLRKTVELCRQYRSAESPKPLGDAERQQLLEMYNKILAVRNTRPNAT